MAKKLEDLERNDVPGAVALFKEEWRRTRGKPSHDLGQTLIMLQDDPDEYLRRVAAFVATKRAG